MRKHVNGRLTTFIAAVALMIMVIGGIKMQFIVQRCPYTIWTAPNYAGLGDVIMYVGGGTSCFMMMLAKLLGRPPRRIGMISTVLVALVLLRLPFLAEPHRGYFVLALALPIVLGASAFGFVWYIREDGREFFRQS